MTIPDGRFAGEGFAGRVEVCIPARKGCSLISKCRHILSHADRGERIEKHFRKFTSFAQKYIHINYECGRWEQLKDSSYDVVIVGSDGVWFQWRGFTKRTKFLDFVHERDATLGKGAVKIAYAASFGRDYIPPENIRAVKRCLQDLSAISVREKCSKGLLESIGIRDVVHACDLVLLLSREEWEAIEEKPVLPDMEKEYCFAYLIGQDEEQRDSIMRLCRQEGLCLVTIPFIDGYEGKGTDCFGDVRVRDCSPGEWVWLIHHAQYVVTDSFHGLVFSSLFSTKFIAVQRASQLDLNMRLEDYLDTLGEKDKYVEIGFLQSLSGLRWDEERMHEKLEMYQRIRGVP